MRTRSDRTYEWIEKKTERLSQWLDRLIEKHWFRILILLIAAGISLWGYRQSEGAFLRSIAPEMFGIVMTVVIIDGVNEWRQTQERKQILIAQLGSHRRDVTELALIELRNRDWLYDGSLSTVILRGADLEGAAMSGAVLFEAHLSFAKLNGAKLIEAKLEHATLTGSELKRAEMSRARLKGAKLEGAKFDGADLIGALMEGANLEEASFNEWREGEFPVPTNLGGAHLEGAKLAEAQLKNALMSQARLDKADLYYTNLEQADLRGACLHGVMNWSISQLDAAGSKAGATMPDGERLGIDEESGPLAFQPVIGRNYKRWRESYLQEHEGEAHYIRDPKNGVTARYYPTPPIDS